MGRTNKPGTCLWCGKRLAHNYHTEWEDTDKKAPGNCVYCHCPAEKGEPEADLYDEDYHYPGYCCPECKRPVLARKVRKVASRVKVWKEAGYMGNGFFCTAKHGFYFAEAAARNGYRFEPEND